MRFLAAAFCPLCLDARALFCPPAPPQTRPHGPAATAECVARAEILCHSEGTETGDGGGAETVPERAWATEAERADVPEAISPGAVCSLQGACSSPEDVGARPPPPLA